eukprot:785808-Ditylum_brightwellii.AAC.1
MKGVTMVARWLANTRLAWAAYEALVVGRLIALDKCLGICPMWDDHAKEDGWRILLVDACNAFNEVN